MPRTCAIIGGGIAGLAAGIAMRKAGFAVTVYERAPAIVPMGAALSIWGNAMAGLDGLGCGDAVRARAAQIRKVSLGRKDGRMLMGPMDVSTSDSFLPTRALLQQILLDHLGPENVRLDAAVADANLHDGKAAVELEDGTIASADILIAADGIHSRIGKVLSGIEPQFAGYVGALGLCNTPQQPLPSGFAREFWGDDDRFGVFDAGQGMRYWFYMRSAGRAADVAEMTLPKITECAAQWPDPVASTLAAAQECIPVAIHAKPPPKVLGNGRIICIGDAAHPMQPNQGQGACQSIEDAWALAVLAQRLPPEQILPALEHQRLKRVRSYVRESALMGQAAHMPNRFVRAAVLGSFALTPRWAQERQLLSRLVVPVYH
ncbi:FAD-dependent monooxygenase [Pontixanthobacter aquaemixtae]|uniref:NAD(P)-binding protein n=1 Tax=Pontixanthobacter aquaemixtae TaxID=1958940 RepID=A0A844ZTB7_9SPHN|nr:FAD-dependent monooxygenase [Pontixanthobacter aquaemixtae]MXO91105.1 NAD(P)-binding protein [Pontixanthobacter aquaemixtae]